MVITDYFASIQREFVPHFLRVPSTKRPYFKVQATSPCATCSLLAQCREKMAQTPSSATACTCLVQGRQQPARRRKDGADEVRPQVGREELPRVEQVGRRKGQKV